MVPRRMVDGLDMTGDGSGLLFVIFQCSRPIRWCAQFMSVATRMIITPISESLAPGTCPNSHSRTPMVNLYLLIYGLSTLRRHSRVILQVFSEHSTASEVLSRPYHIELQKCVLPW